MSHHVAGPSGVNVHLEPVSKQLEFYFSEGNLPRDKFMQKVMRENAPLCTVTAGDPESSIMSFTAPLPVRVLLSFRKLSQLCNNKADMIIRAVKISPILELVEDDTENSPYIRRCAPFVKQPKRDQIDRTIYMARLPRSCTHETLREFLLNKLPEKTAKSSKYPILFISLPLYKTSQEVRGFGFVEFRKVKHARIILGSLMPSTDEEKRQCAWEYFSRYTKKTQALVKSAQQMGLEDPFKTNGGYRYIAEEHGFNLSLGIWKQEWLNYKDEFRAWQSKECNVLSQRIQGCAYEFVSEKRSTSAHLNVSTLHEAIEQKDEVIDTPFPLSYETGDAKDTILRITPLQELHSLYRATIRQALNSFQSEIAYLDVQDLRREGFVRFKTSRTAQSILEEKEKRPDYLPDYKVVLLSEAETLDYMQKIETDKLKKSEQKKRRACKRQAQLNFQMPSHKKLSALGPPTEANVRRDLANNDH